MDAPAVTDALVARFWSHVDRRGSDECWPWTAAQTKGYGHFKVGKRCVTATRYAYLLTAGKWPGRYMVCHACDNPICVNPAHLWLGLAADNTRDMVAKGRMILRDTRGSKNGAAKLTEADVVHIRRLIADGLTNTGIAPQFGVHHSMISLIRSGKFWKHVQEDAA